MNFQVLKYFTVLAEELHFGRAAAKLNITQPPLSTAIKSLEDELGVELFQRTKSQVQLTPAGAAFVAEARKVLESVARAKSLVQSFGKGIVGRLDIGFSPTLLYRGILEIIDDFEAAAPGIEILLHEMPSSEQFERLARGRLDAGFAYGSIPPPELASIPLREDSFALCVHEHHRLAGEPMIQLQDLAGEEFVMFAREINPMNHDRMISLLSQAGIYPRFRTFTRAWMTVMAMVSEGRGIGIVSVSLARMRMGGVRVIPIAGPRLPADALLAWNPALVAPATESLLASARRTIDRQGAAGAEAGRGEAMSASATPGCAPRADPGGQPD